MNYCIRIFILLIICTILSSCAVISFTKSEKRTLDHETVEIAPEINITATGAVFMKLFGVIKSDFFPSGFMVEIKDAIVYIDPVVVDDSTKADYILITHTHADHFSKTDIENLSSNKTLIIAPENVTKKLQNFNTKSIKLRDTLLFENFTCEVVPAYNIKTGFFHMPIHKKSNNFVGYIISSDSTRIYHAGDTDFIPEMHDFENITVALVPIGEGKTAMNPETAAKAIYAIQPKLVIPMHFELDQNRENEFLQLLNENIAVKILK